MVNITSIQADSGQIVCDICEIDIYERIITKISLIGLF